MLDIGFTILNQTEVVILGVGLSIGLGVWFVYRLLKMQSDIKGPIINEEEIENLKSKASQVPLLEQSIEILRDENYKLDNSNKEYTSRNMNLNVQLATSKKDVESFSSELKELNNSLENKETKIEELRQSNSQLLLDKQNISNELRTAQKGFIEKEDFYKSQIKILEDEQNKIKVYSDNLQEKNSTIFAQKEKLSGELSVLQEEYERYKENANAQINELKEKAYENREEIKGLNEALMKESTEKATFQEALSAQKEGNEKLKKDFDEQSQNLALKLNEIMNQNLESKLKKFDDSSMKSLGDLLKPFKEDLNSFKKKVEENQESGIQKFAEMSKQIEHIAKMGASIGEEAQNLTKALKGNKQVQGSWGEMILEAVLEYSGLQKGMHYTTQDSYRDDEGRNKRPDVVVKLPQERSMIIDSKVSLVDYDAYIRAESEAEITLASKAIVKAFKNHIDTLASKDYTEYNVGTLQYIFMFVPVESAFAVAIREDYTLYEYALKKHIVIANPSTLLVSLRTIYLYWQSELSTTNAIRMFDEAGKLHQKMAGFVNDFAKIESQLQTVSNTYGNAKQKLTEGTGNLMKRVEDLKHLGARTTKTLKDAKLQYDDFDEDDAYLEVLPEDNQIQMVVMEN